MSAALVAQSVSNDVAPHSLQIALELVAVCGAVFLMAGLAYLVMRTMARAREGDRDPPRTRTFAAFEVPGTTDDLSRLGALAAALREPLAAHGVSAEPPQERDGALFVPLAVKDDLFVLRLAREGTVFVAAVLDRGPATAPPTAATLAPLEGPPLLALLDALNRAVRRVPGEEGLRWHRREAWAAGDRTGGSHHPTDA